MLNKHILKARNERAKQYEDQIEYELDVIQMKNPRQPPCDRMKGAMHAVAEKLDQKVHLVKESYHNAMIHHP